MLYIDETELDDIYTRIVADAGPEGISKTDVDAAMDLELITRYGNQTIPFAEHARYLRASYTKNRRRERTTEIVNNVEWLVDFLNNPNEAAFLGFTYWDVPFTLAGGSEKLFKYWVIQDLQDLIEKIELKANAMQVQASDLALCVARIKDARNTHGGLSLYEIAEHASQAVPA